MSLQVRLDKTFKNLAAFSEEIVVTCPHCGNRSYVLTTLGKYTVPYPFERGQSKFQCNHCFKPINEILWYGPVIISPKDAKCGNCGSRLEKHSEQVNKIKKEIKIKCEVCGQERIYETEYRHTYANDTQATDPYFGLQLWLQTPIDNNILWAYNFAHLAYLRQYVSAKLRETASGGKYSLAWKLPNFIKSEKNRTKILKGIERLEKK